MLRPIHSRSSTKEQTWNFNHADDSERRIFRCPYFGVAWAIDFMKESWAIFKEALRQHRERNTRE